MEPATVKVSNYVAADDLVAGLDWLLEQIEESVILPADEYAEDTQERIKKNALLTAVTAMNLSQHDTANTAQAGAVELHAAALELAKVVKDQAAAKAQFSKLKTARQTTAAGAQVPWSVVRGQGALMKKANELHSSVKRNLTAEKFTKQQDVLQRQSALLAAFAQSVVLDTHEVKDPVDLPTWTKYAEEFRTQTGKLNAAVRAGDHAAAEAAFKAADAACHACHRKFDPAQVQ